MSEISMTLRGKTGLFIRTYVFFRSKYKHFTIFYLVILSTQMIVAL